MLPEQRAAYVIAQSTACFCEAQAMIAANKEREADNKALAYGEKEFMELPERFGLHHNQLLSLFHDC